MTERLEGKGFYGDIPGTWIRDAYSPDGWRFIASAHGWNKLRWERLGTRCNKCPNIGSDMHHVHGRGGGKRDDRPLVNSEWNLEWLCRTCHDAAVIAKRRPVLAGRGE